MALMVWASNPEEDFSCNNAHLLPHLNPLIQWLTPGVGGGLDSMLNENRQNGLFNLNLSGLWWHGCWLPQGNTWETLPTKYSDMLYPLGVALPILLLRVLFETFVACKLDWAAGIKTSNLPVTPCKYQ
uniref:Uncharacterized protein n=1 Tax=Ditylenchus dipsaci TaxID=166011 RepID=A0A915ENF4_9BILA